MSFNRIRKTYLADVPEPVLEKNKLSGTINEADTEDRTVWAYDRRDGELLGTTIVNRDTRQWELYIDPAHDDESITLFCRDEGPNYNGDIFDRVSLCMTEYPYPVGVMGLVEYPGTYLINAHASPNFYNQYCDVDVPELKGDIVKVIQDGTQIDKAYPIKFVNAAGNEITNDVTDNNIVVNDDSVILSKVTRAPNLVTWRKDIFNDNSEIFHPVWDGKIWKNYYGGQPFEVCHNTHPEIDPSCLPGKFYEAAFCVEEKQGVTPHWGPRCNIDTPDVHVMSVSFWYKSTGKTTTEYTNYSPHYAVQDIVCLRNTVRHISLFRFGIDYTRYSPSSNNHYQKRYYLSVYSAENTAQTINETDFSFGRWNHIVIIYTSTSVDLYINKTLVKTLTFAATQVGDVSSITLGKSKQNSDYSNAQVTGIYSGLRIFKKAISDAEIEQLYNDVPVAETEVHSIKGMEHSDGLICLGGIPYKPLCSNTESYENILKDGTKQYILAHWSNKNVGFTLHEDCVEFWGSSVSAGVYTGLSSLPDGTSTNELGFSLADIDIYMRVYLMDSGYVLKIGNSTYSMLLFWYNNDYGMMVQWKNSSGPREIKHIASFSRPAIVKNRWIRIKWLQNKIYFYEDDGTTLIGEYTLNNYSIHPATQGQISVGTNRGGSIEDSGTTDAYGGKCKVSDLFIYEKGKMDTDAPIVKYELGYNRHVFDGLQMWTSASTVITREEGGDIQELNDASYFPVSHAYAQDWDNSNIFNGRGFTFVSHVYLKKYSYNGVYFPIHINGLWGLAVAHDTLRWIFRGYALNANSIASNRYFDLNLYAPLNYSDELRQWYHMAYTYNQSNNRVLVYAQGCPLTGIADQLISPILTTDDLTIINHANALAAFSNLYMYPVALPHSSIRNAAQNYKLKCYKDEMLVAFINENTDYPIYANTPLTKINIEGDDNGQVLTFACTKDNIDYYIFTTEWKKILTKEGDFWMYWDGSTWQNGGTVKWKAASLAMDIPDNRMSLQRINSLNAVQLNTLHDLNNGTFNFAVGMKSDGNISPYIDRITLNNEKVWLSEVYNLADFGDTNYITKVHLSKVLNEGWSDGIKLFVHNSNELGWIECPNFQEVPSIIKNNANTGTVQFKVVFDQSKDNAKENALLEVTIK